jgi:hypothetical protein
VGLFPAGQKKRCGFTANSSQIAPSKPSMEMSPAVNLVMLCEEIECALGYASFRAAALRATRRLGKGSLNEQYRQLENLCYRLQVPRLSEVRHR